MQVMLVLASAPSTSFLRNDLSSSGKLQFKVHARELGAQPVQMLDVDLAPLVHLPLKHPAGAAGPLSNGNQTMAIAAVYTVRCAENSLQCYFADATQLCACRAANSRP